MKRTIGRVESLDPTNPGLFLTNERIRQTVLGRKRDDDIEADDKFDNYCRVDAVARDESDIRR